MPINPYSSLGPSPGTVRATALDWGRPVREIKPPKLSLAEIRRAERAQRRYWGNNPYNTLGPSPRAAAKVNKTLGRGPTGKLLAAKKAGGAKLAQEQTIEQYMQMLGGKQKSALDALLEDSRRRSQAEQMSLAGFGAALQGYSHDLWGQTTGAYQQAAAQQQAVAQGLGGQIGSGVAEMRAQEAALAGGLGHSGETALPTPEAAAAQVASEGGAETGKMMGQVGTAWGGYGATRPEYIGFMTGQNQMQVAREQIEADRDLKSKFLELSMDNPKEAQAMWLAAQENKRSNISTSIAQQTLKTNIAMQRAQITQKYAEMRLNAKTDAEKLRITREENAEKRRLNNQELLIDQQTADARTTSANASMTSAEASEARARETARNNKWKREHPGASGSRDTAKYQTGPYQQKIASAMYNAHALFDDSGGKDKAGYAFSILWPQMATFIPAGQQAAARRLLMQRLKNSAAKYKPKPSSGGGGSRLN